VDTKLLTIGIVAIVCVGALAAYFIVLDDGGDDGPIQIVDGSGATITLDEPLTGAATVNSNVPKAMKILGLADEVLSMSLSDATWDSMKDQYTNAVRNGTTSSLTAEKLLEVSKYVICPVSSMTITGDKVTACENLGITIIRLDCFGDSTLDDLDKIATLFGRTNEIKDALNSYYNIYNSVKNTVAGKVSAAPGTASNTFLSYMNSSTAFYNQTSAISVMTEEIYGKNALRNISGLDLSNISNPTADGLREKIVEEDAARSIDKIFIRGSSSTNTASAALTMWNGSKIASDYTALSAVGSNSVNKIYVFDSDFMSGLMGYIGFVLIAEACGIDTGLNVATLITEFNTTYGFDEGTSGCMFMITIASGVASASEIVVT